MEQSGDSRKSSGQGQTALGSLRSKNEVSSRLELQLAALEACGELGYRQLTVERLIERVGASRARFYRAFRDKADCFTQAYELSSELLSADLLAAACAGDDWIDGYRKCLWALADFIASEPLLARATLVEVHVAGGAARAKRKEVFERLSRAVDSARREISSRHSPPPVTAAFILSAIETTVMRFYADPEAKDFADCVPGLLYIGVSVYFGRDAARAAVDASGRP